MTTTSRQPQPTVSQDTQADASFPRVSGVPLFGNLLEAWKSPLDLFLRGVAEQGEDVHLRFLHLDYLLLTRPASVHHVLVAQPERYTKSVNYDGLKVVLGNGLLTSEGTFWKKQRRLMQPAFHRSRLTGFVDTMGRATLEMLDRWEREGARAFDLHQELMRLTFRIVGLTLLSQDLDGDARAVGEALSVALEWANAHVESVVRVPLWMPTPANLRFKRARATLDEMVLRLIAERRAAPHDVDQIDLLDMLLDVQDADTGERMNDEQIKHELLTLVLAGHETTANALSFLFYLLAKHPDVHARVADEARAVIGDRVPTAAELKQLELTTCVIEEAMRLYPPAWVFERQAQQDDEIDGRRIRKGTVVGMSPYVVQRSPLHWSEPDRFDPTRFAPAGRSEINKYVFMPFGGGHRFCIGNQFAMMEMQAIVALLATRCRFTIAPDFALTLEPMVTLRPARGIPVTLERV